MKKLFAILFFVTLSAGCARAKMPVARNAAPEGKIIIRYEYTPADLKSPPAAFDVLRSEVRTGPFAVINKSPIKVNPSLQPGDIQDLLTDQPLPLGRQFYYYIVKADSAGHRAKATSVAPATVLLPLSGGPAVAAESTTLAKKSDVKGERVKSVR